MLYYVDVCLSRLEVPDETSICIYISGCPNRCSNCHFPELQRPDYGDLLELHYRDIIKLYRFYATCVCFLGEGGSTSAERAELSSCAAYARRLGLKTCLYTGRDTDVEPWMHVFDYVKTGSYREDRGPLSSPTTNQRFFRRDAYGRYMDMTSAFRTI